LADALSCDGPEIVIDTVDEQLFASVTVKLYVPAGRVNVPVPEYGGVPPEAVTVIVELLLVQVSGVEFAEATSCDGSVIVTDSVAVQLLASVTVKE
jgi:hypothetical protein